MVPMVFRPVEATSRKPYARAGAGARHARLRKTTASAKANLSGQPGRRHVNAPPDEPKVKAGGLRERERRGAQIITSS